MEDVDTLSTLSLVGSDLHAEGSVDVRREAPEPWATAMRDRGMLHGQRPSFSQLAAAARDHTTAGTLTPQAVIDIVTGKTQDPADEIVRALASALALPVEEVARWVGRPLDVGAPYVPPNGADRLSRKQREALDHIIRVMIDREDVGQHAASIADDESVSDSDNVTEGPWRPERDPATPGRRAARKGKKQRTDEPGDGA